MQKCKKLHSSLPLPVPPSPDCNQQHCNHVIAIAIASRSSVDLRIGRQPIMQAMESPTPPMLTPTTMLLLSLLALASLLSAASLLLVLYLWLLLSSLSTKLKNWDRTYYTKKGHPGDIANIRTTDDPYLSNTTAGHKSTVPTTFTTPGVWLTNKKVTHICTKLARLGSSELSG
jgi:hypothetical protein